MSGPGGATKYYKCMRLAASLQGLPSLFKGAGFRVPVTKVFVVRIPSPAPKHIGFSHLTLADSWFNKHKMFISQEDKSPGIGAECHEIRAPEIFDLLMEIIHNRLSVITHMFPDPPAGSGPDGQNSPCATRPRSEEAKIIPILGGFVPWLNEND